MACLLEFGVFITAAALPRCVSLGRAAKVAIAKVPAAKMVDTWQFLQLVKVLRAAAELPIATVLPSPSLPPAAVLFPVLRAVFDVIHAETLFYLTSVVVTEAPQVTSAIVV